ncbi:hypothetical protein [Nostocoides sp.]|uniref:hypothetical protein n=1 Tax=Nostocoides sp. TaxID=1917966 RepID=UPI003BB00C34
MLLVALPLSLFAWWVNQGGENWIGTMLYNWSLVALGGVVLVVGGGSLIWGRSRRVPHRP